MRFALWGKVFPVLFFHPQIIFDCQLIEDFSCKIRKKKKKEKPRRGKTYSPGDGLLENCRRVTRGD